MEELIAALVAQGVPYAEAVAIAQRQAYDNSAMLSPQQSSSGFMPGETAGIPHEIAQQMGMPGAADIPPQMPATQSANAGPVSSASQPTATDILSGSTTFKVNPSSGDYSIGVGGISMSGSWGGKKSEEKQYAKAKRKALEEQTRQEKMQRKLIDPTGMLQEGKGGNVNMYVLATGGPATRIPVVANTLLRMAGEEPLTPREQLLNFVRPAGLPIYAAANEVKLYNSQLQTRLAMRRLGQLAFGIAALGALASL